MDEDQPTVSERSGCLFRLLGGLFVVSLLVGALFFYGAKAVTGRITGFIKESFGSQKIDTLLNEFQLSSFSLPEGYTYNGLYRHALGVKDLWMFVARPADDKQDLPKEADAALDLALYTRPTYVFFVHRVPTIVNADVIQKIDQNLRGQGYTEVIQDKIWVSGNERSVILNQTMKVATSYRTFVVETSTGGVLLILNPVSAAVSYEPVLASIFKVAPTDISLVAPAPPVVEAPPPAPKKVVKKKAGKKVSGKTKSKKKKSKR